MFFWSDSGLIPDRRLEDCDPQLERRVGSMLLGCDSDCQNDELKTIIKSEIILN